MNDFVSENGGTSREELVQRVALMEAMIAEGRRTTARYGWMFVMWGLLYIAAMGWTVYLPMRNFAWPVCIVVGLLLGVVVRMRRKRAGAMESQRSRNIGAVWNGMGIAVSLYVVAAVWGGHGSEPVYVAAIMFMVGMAHGISALILRWGAQGAAAAAWWACGVACCFATTVREIEELYVVAAFFGMEVFGMYVMLLERRRPTGAVQQHA
ncbi:MAG: hypothetical protein HIU91_10710 [Acidobacteria bacterium]|nr:hypothetical protein [Acidobacteriota bacterium]